MVKKFNDWLLEKAFADKYNKHKFIELQQEDVADYAEILSQLVQSAYSNIGGGGDEFSSAKALLKSDIKFWIAADIDDDPDADVALGGKKTANGTKITAIGHDGTSSAKKEGIKKMIELVRTNGCYAEIEPELAQRFGMAYIKDENVIQKVIGAKHNITMQPDGSYTRKIMGTGKVKVKVLVGIPKL